MTNEEILDHANSIALNTISYATELFHDFVSNCGSIDPLIFFDTDIIKRMSFIGKRLDGASVFAYGNNPLLAILCTNKTDDPDDYDVLIYLKRKIIKNIENGDKKTIRAKETTEAVEYSFDYTIKRKEIMKW